MPNYGILDPYDGVNKTMVIGSMMVILGTSATTMKAVTVVALVVMIVTVKMVVVLVVVLVVVVMVKVGVLIMALIS